MNDRHHYVLNDNGGYTWVPAPVIPGLSISIRGTFLLRGESVIFNFDKTGEMIGTVSGEGIKADGKTSFYGIAAVRQIVQTLLDTGSVKTEEHVFPDKESLYFELTMLNNAVAQAFADDGDNGAVRYLSTARVKELAGNVLRAVTPIIENMKYAIKEKDAYGKYWHDLAQERMATIADLQRKSAQVKTTLTKLLTEKPTNL